MAGWQRNAASAVGLLAGSAGAVAVFTTTNGPGTTALLLLGAVFLLIGVVGVVPSHLKIGDNEVTLQQTAESLRNTGLTPDASPKDSLRDLAITYEATRRALPSGGQRTVLLEGVLLQARSLAPTINADALKARLDCFDLDSEGARAITLAILEVKRVATSETLATMLTCMARPRSNFEQYHALRAAWETYPFFDKSDQTALKAAAQGYLNGPTVDKSGDRARLAKNLLNRDVKEHSS